MHFNPDLPSIMGPKGHGGIWHSLSTAQAHAGHSSFSWATILEVRYIEAWSIHAANWGIKILRNAGRQSPLHVGDLLPLTSNPNVLPSSLVLFLAQIYFNSVIQSMTHSCVCWETEWSSCLLKQQQCAYATLHNLEYFPYTLLKPFIKYIYQSICILLIRHIRLLLHLWWTMNRCQWTRLAKLTIMRENKYFLTNI